MASTTLRLRRALSFSSTLIARSTTSASSTVAVCHTIISRSSPISFPPPPTINSLPAIGSRFLHSTSLSLLASRSYNREDDQIDENTILFEGCDYKHWLIVMDFPKDPRPSPEEMVETYVQTLAKVVGSVEEAKKRMYACSTTTYTGFQAEMDEEVSKKFEDMPGVIFVLPDSYIDPVNKEYGGDKYINGTIIPRPPPVQYGRQRRQRVPPQDQQGYPEQGRMQRDGLDFRPQQNFQQQNCGPPSQNFPSQQKYPPRENHGPTQNYPPRENHGPTPNYPPWQNHGPTQNYPPRENHGPTQNYPPRGNHGPTQNYPPQQNYAPPQNHPPQQNYAPHQNHPPHQNVAPPRQGERMDPSPPYNQGNNNQGNAYPSRNQRWYSGESQQNFAPPPSSSGGANYDQGGHGSYGQNQTGHYENGTSGKLPYGYAARGEEERFNPRDEQNFGGQK